MSGLCAHNSPSSSFVNCNGLASYESNRAKLAASKPASATKHLFDPFPVLLALLESWIFLLLWMRPNFINHKGHEVTRRGGSVKALLQPTKHLFGPFPALLAPLESWIFLLLWMVSFINHKGHEVTRRGTLLRFRS